jgi:phosphoglycolate phosphatase
MPDAVLFDLDGTLADSAPDLGAALNALLVEEGGEPLPFGRLRPHVSQGVRGLLRAGFALEPGAPEYDRLSARFLALYEDRLCRETRLFSGVTEVLAALESAGVAWGIVTNKRRRFTDPLVAQLALYPRTTCVVSGDTTAAAKPSPIPVLHACAHLGCAPARTVYVGDDIRDIQAGQAAGCMTVAAAWGYLGDSGPVTSWNADAIIAHPEELLGVLAGLR